MTLKSTTMLALSQLVLATYLVSTAYAAPVPKASNGADNSNSTSLNDPFSTPDYLSPGPFTWESCLYGALFIFFGLVEVFHGYKYIRFTMLFAGFIIWSSTVVMIMLIIDINSGTYQSSGLYFGIWLAVGLVGAIVSFYLWHVGIILTGAYAAFVVVAVIFTAANLTNYVVRYTILAIVVVVGGILTRKFERMAVILATSFGGSYCFFFGLDMFVQTGFRSTMHVILSQSTDRFHPVPGTWVMIGLVPVLAVIGILYELHRHEEPVGGWWFGQGARPLPPLPGEKRRKCCGFVLASPPPKKVDADTQDAEANHSNTDGVNKQKEHRFCGLFQKKAAQPSSALSSTSVSATTLTANTKAQVSSAAKQNTKVSAKITITSTDGDHSPPPPPPKPVTPKVPLKQRWRNCVGTLCCAPYMKHDANKQRKGKRVEVAAPEVTNMTEARVRVTTHPAGEKQSDLTSVSSASKPSASKVQSSVGHETVGHTGKHKIVIQKHVREYSLEIEDKW
ncbi:hypothetical protein BGZ73_001683 [Actinomortierella ambigua]|nr:hypothetical protein BGZ73_001683 [Actinomortierella ambigua]